MSLLLRRAANQNVVPPVIVDEVANQYGGIVRNWEDDAISRWLDAVYEAREAAREAEPTDEAIEEVAEARHTVTFVDAPVDLSDLAVKLGALENALSQAETQIAIDRKRQAIEIEVTRILEAHAAHEAMEARETERKRKELQDEEEMIVLMLFAS